MRDASLRYVVVSKRASHDENVENRARRMSLQLRHSESTIPSNDMKGVSHRLSYAHPCVQACVEIYVLAQGTKIPTTSPRHKVDVDKLFSDSV